MVAIHNIVAVCAVLGLKDQEGAILKKTFIPTLAYGFILAVWLGFGSLYSRNLNHRWKVMLAPRGREAGKEIRCIWRHPVLCRLRIQ